MVPVGVLEEGKDGEEEGVGEVSEVTKETAGKGKGKKRADHVDGNNITKKKAKG